MSFTLLLFVSILVVGRDCGSPRGDIQVEEHGEKRYAVYSPKLSRDDFLFNEPGNASLYVNVGSHNSHPPANRVSRALDLDVYVGDKTKRQFSGTRQSRILNEDKKPNLAIQGFIPIVSVGQPSVAEPEKISEVDDHSESSPQGYQGYAGPADAKFIGAALQNLAASIGAKPKRKLFHHFQPNRNSECVCVPFYMCKNGFLESTGKNGQNVAYNTKTYEENLAAAQSELNRHSIPAQLSSFYEQQAFQNTGQLQPLIDERSIEGSRNTNQNLSTPEYVTDVFSKISGRSNFGSLSCGVLRTCCRYHPTYSPEFTVQQFQVPHSSHPNIQNNYYPHFAQPETNLPFLRPQSPNIYHPNHGIYGGIQKPFNHQVAPSVISNEQVHPYPLGEEYQMPPQFNGNSVKRYIPGHSEVNYRPEQSIPVANHMPSVGRNLCGVRNAVGIHGRVQNLQYHESSTEFGEYPWQVALLKRLGPADSLYVCGGVLISEQWVATAAHCIKKNGPSDLKVRLGEWDVHREDEFYPFVERFIDEIIIHPQFYGGNLINDVALLRLNSPVDLNIPTVAAACLPERFEVFDGHRCWVTGWGKNSFGHKGTFQSVLKEVDVPIVNQAQCEHVLRKTRLGAYYELHPGFLCAGGEPGKDACEGDGGSPLVCEVRGIWKVVGLVSWGIGCGQPGVPGVYVNLSYYRDWLDSIINKYAVLNTGFDSNAIIERSNANATEERSFQRYSIENFITNATTVTTMSSRYDAYDPDDPRVKPDQAKPDEIGTNQKPKPDTDYEETVDKPDDLQEGKPLNPDLGGVKPTDGACTCVPYYQCDNGKIVDDGTGIIDPRKKPASKTEIPLDGKFQPPYCGTFHVCCSEPDTSTQQPYVHRCGVRNPSGINRRVLSPADKGESDFGEWPWQVAILKNEKNVNLFQCGAVLIDAYHILTVAHCVHNYTGHEKYLKARLGEWDTQNTNEFLPHEDYDVVSVVIHPEYKHNSLWNDIAVLKLDRKVIFAPNIDSICLPHIDEIFDGQQCVTTGWGKNAYRGGSYSNILKEVSLPIIPFLDCQEGLRKTRLGYRFKLHESFICAGGEQGRDSCKGDGGGPLTCYRKDGTYALVGLVSWGIDCGSPGVPGVYVKVQKYVDWITKVTGSNIKQYRPNFS
ncbi:Serine proteinase stubble-like protein [Leptotrombidium deliense]|uniref:Serine proteinase stubble-like protein n=1 Tax=Leptotrombidium deliense TaxID=299467 RepID=A0A443SIT9_9ACAR|nr:Serine proteinase stubble-like protein [Leptotrombidium deliense]